jgi:tetratricopeptide (TPR) repeat protein
MNIKFAQALLACLYLYSATVAAELWDKPSDAELTLLPPYCATKLKHLPDYDSWRQALGPSFDDVHHYCGALIHLNRYYKSNNPQDRKFFIKNMFTNMDYMFTHVKPSQPRDVLLPEMHFSMGRMLIVAGKPAQATNEFLKAIELKPDYVEPYAALADQYAEHGKKREALNTLEQGLSHAPESRSLLRRYRELGGKKSFAAPSAPTVSGNSQTPNTQGTDISGNASAQPSVPIPAPNAAETMPATQPLPTPDAEASPKIGSPTNPYCRFCP